MVGYKSKHCIKKTSPILYSFVALNGTRDATTLACDTFLYVCLDSLRLIDFIGFVSNWFYVQFGSRETVSFENHDLVLPIRLLDCWEFEKNCVLLKRHGAWVLHHPESHFFTFSGICFVVTAQSIKQILLKQFFL